MPPIECPEGQTVACTCEGNGHSGTRTCSGNKLGDCLCPSPFEDMAIDASTD